MIWPFHNKTIASYWLRVFALYALVEALIQLLFFVILNNFGTRPISIIEFHILMLFFQCLLIWPIWWVAWSVRKQKLITQIFVNLGFYIVYSYLWFGPVQDIIGYLYNNLLTLTRTEGNRLAPSLDRGDQYSYLNYQLLKHAFRLSWFYLAAYFYNYRIEEQKRTKLAVANKELQLKMLKWHLNPSFYFKTINHLRDVAVDKPMNATGPILQLAKVMEYVIYEAKEKLIDVKKEIHFLNNYVQLINQQGNGLSIEMEVTGDHAKLKIAPLLMAGFIDKMASGNGIEVKSKYNVQLEFSSQEMQMQVTSDSGSLNGLFLLPEDVLLKRLKEIYPSRFSVSYSSDKKIFTLKILLDDE